MRTMQVHLHSVQDVRNFVNITSKYAFPIAAQTKDGYVDAKSLIGLFTADLHKPLQIEFEASDADASRLCDEIGKFCAV